MAHGPGPDSRPFPGRMRESLCDLLLKLPDMHTPARRDHVFRQVTKDYPKLNSIARQDLPRADLLEFVSAACDYPGALRRLLEVVSYLYAPDDRLHAISQLIAAVEPEDLLMPAERQQIVGHLLDVDEVIVAGAFHYSTRTTVAEAGLELSDVAAVVTRAESFPASPGGLPPLFEFVDYIAHRCDQSTKATLHDWMDAVSWRIGHKDRSAVNAVCRATENRLVLSGRYFLVTEVRPDGVAPDRYFLAAWRQHQDEPEEPLYQSDRSVSWDEAIKTIHKLMQELAGVVEHTAQERVLELILPRRLVTHSVDQWPVGSVLASPIGTVYPLVLRSFDRLNDRDMHLPWGKNWAWLKEHSHRAGVNALGEVDSHDHQTAEALRAALRRNGPPAVVFMLRPLPDSDDLGPDAFTAAIQGGAPIMIWSRDATTAAELADWIRGVCEENLLDLPEQVFQLRLHALNGAGAATAGSHVALVYDDHDRIPEKYRRRAKLRSPNKRRQNV